jgi:transposase-like protein
MGKPYSEDLRRSVVQAIESGHTYEEVAELYGVSVSSVSRFLTLAQHRKCQVREVWWLQGLRVGAIQVSDCPMGGR